MKAPLLLTMQDGCRKKAQMEALARDIAALLYSETDPEEVKTLAGIEKTVREQIVNYVSPEIGNFLSQKAAAQIKDEPESSKAFWEN